MRSQIRNPDRSPPTSPCCRPLLADHSPPTAPCYPLLANSRQPQPTALSTPAVWITAANRLLPASTSQPQPATADSLAHLCPLAHHHCPLPAAAVY
ncbi:hypothetical protein PCASD_09845 [Puccinia coronata f. sp. avenae]|uniref:Uncharacterized protein n=1 Tax=Puccinia coronata f. sp. avenae TaxID=200324 RepID=A0A2N5UM91_9BASI|nr:hypothetical protein PCASD_09845 [Puccinia coronata f. sp. avenae]